MREYSKEVYSREVLLKAAYAFTDVLYIHLDADKEKYKVALRTKTGDSEEDIYEAFENELIAQENRRIISEKTKNIREMIVARSLSSTMVNMDVEDDSEMNDYNADDILVDWFENE